MNVLTDCLPSSVIIDNEEYEINTDYRAAVQFEIMLDNGVDSAYKLMQPFFPNGLPQNVLGAFKAIMWHYACGENIPQNNKENIKNSKNNRAYSFEIDADTIFADFLRYYNINLSSVNIHWFTFRALLMGLPQDSGFKQLIYYRTCDTKGMSKAEKERISKIKKLVSLDKPKDGERMTLEERNERMKNYVKQKNNHR